MENVKKATATTTWMVPTAQEGKNGSSAGPVPPPECCAVRISGFCNRLEL